jgi:hypothetical protein
MEPAALLAVLCREQHRVSLVQDERVLLLPALAGG